MNRQSEITNQAAWRTDAAGLRGVAVSAVLIYHAVPEWLTGGFMGVDLFFVLSGFLMTRIISNNLRAGSFSYSQFYASRARRLLPSLSLVLLATLAATPIFLAPTEIEAVGRQIAASAFFLGNFLAWSQAGYFGGSANLKPLIHLWSLGVEEQFYLLFPAFLVVINRRWPASLKVWLAMAMLASFVGCAIVTPINPDMAFYWPFTRFWEFLGGALVAVLEQEGWQPSPRTATRLSAAGVALLATSFILMADGGGFPGWRAALPVAGACFVLLGGPDTPVARFALARGPMPFLGKISYAAYLWHWPLLVFARWHLNGDLEPFQAVAVTTVALVMAWRTTALIEDPFRFAVALRTRFVAPTLFLGTSIIAATAMPASSRLATLIQKRSTRSAIIERMMAIPNYLPGDPWRESSGCFINLNLEREFGEPCLGGVADRRPLGVIWGDSNAAATWPGLSREAVAHGFRLGQLTVSSCAPLVETVTDTNSRCGEMRAHALATLSRLRPQLVIMAARWAVGYDKGRIATLIGPTVEALRQMGVERVVVLGPLPMWFPALPAALAMDAANDRFSDLPDALPHYAVKSVFDWTPRMRELVQAAGGEFIAPIDVLCNADRCRIWADPDRKTRLMTFDGEHLSLEGSSAFASLIAGNLFRGRGGEQDSYLTERK